MLTDSDKYKVRARSLLFSDLDIIGIAETYLKDNNIPMLSGYTVFAHNRKNIHIRARTGSGGVCLFIKKTLLDYYDATILDNSIEDILWVKLINKETLQSVFICASYLSPEGSSRQVDPHEYFDNLLSQIYVHQADGPFMICGDFNARCGAEADYIEGVDDICERDIIDFIAMGTFF